MRRSAAPSFQSAAKRLKFLSPVNSDVQIKKENELFDLWNSESGSTSSYLTTEMTQQQENSVTNFENVNSTEHTAEKLLELLLEPVCQEPEIDKEDAQEKSNSTQNNTNTLLVKQEILAKQNLHQYNTVTSQVTKQTYQNNESHVCESPDLSSSKEVGLCYNVLWCKRSTKKHKIWEGDGILIVKGRSAVLKDPEGKIIDRGIGYKMKEIESLEDGSKFFIGGKECEIQYLMSSEECKNLSTAATPVNNLSDKSSSPKQTNLCM